MKACFDARLVLAAALALGAGAPAAAAESLIYSPFLYQSLSDSPFDHLSFDYFHLERFEGSGRPAGYAVSGGSILGPSALTDSVDADDGAIDGFGRGGSSWFSGGSTDTFVFTFDAAVLGKLPTHVGIVFTDVGDPKPDTGGQVGFGQILFDAFGPGSTPIGGVGSELGDSAVDGRTAEDRFFGVYSPDGVSSIRIRAVSSNDWEVDHLQYGYINPVPEPGSWLLMAASLGILGWRQARQAARAQPDFSPRRSTSSFSATSARLANSRYASGLM